MLASPGIPESHVTRLARGVDIASRSHDGSGVLVIDSFQGPLRSGLEHPREAHKQDALLCDIPLDLCRLLLAEPRFCPGGRGMTSGKHNEIHGLDERYGVTSNGRPLLGCARLVILSPSFRRRDSNGIPDAVRGGIDSGAHELFQGDENSGPSIRPRYRRQRGC